MSRWLEKGNFNAGEYLGRFVRSEVGRSRPGKPRRMAAQCNLALSSRLHKSRSRLPKAARSEIAPYLPRRARAARPKAARSEVEPNLALRQ